MQVCENGQELLRRNLIPRPVPCACAKFYRACTVVPREIRNTTSGPEFSGRDCCADFNTLDSTLRDAAKFRRVPSQTFCDVHGRRLGMNLVTVDRATCYGARANRRNCPPGRCAPTLIAVAFARSSWWSLSGPSIGDASTPSTARNAGNSSFSSSFRWLTSRYSKNALACLAPSSGSRLDKSPVRNHQAAATRHDARAKAESNFHAAAPLAVTIADRPPDRTRPSWRIARL
jgi:hypothetical protein